jgi:2-hydroxychromene-2-carboxylate isomerase
MNMAVSADVYWSFRSPYSYLAMHRYKALAAEHDVTLNLRIVYPLAIRQPDFFEKNHPNWGKYLRMDVARLAQFYDIPFKLPQPDPIVQNLETRVISPDQPHIFRLVRMGQAASRRGKGFAFADEVSQLIWSGTPGWNEGDHLAKASARAGLDFAALEAEAISDADALDTEVAANQARLEASGHWGVPTLVFDGEPFFGQDRIDVAFWRIAQKKAGI